MANDSISTDPALKEEARRAAAEASIPKPPYDPKALAREEWEKVIDPTYEKQTFDDAWNRMLAAYKDMDLGEKVYLGPMTESEYRQFISTVWWGLKAQGLTAAATQALERSETLTKMLTYAIQDKFGRDASKEGPVFPDVVHGTLIRIGADHVSQGTCPVHPNGCPDMHIRNSFNKNQVVDAIRAIIEAKLKK